LQWAFIGTVWCLAVFQFSTNTVDIDLWGHVLYGENFLHTGHLARVETYSWTANGQPWINHEILAEIALALTHRTLGGAGLLLLKMVIGLLTFGLALSMARRQTQPGWSLVAWTFGALAVVQISAGFAARPQIFTALGLVLELWILRQVQDGKHGWGWMLPPLFAVWINTHGGVLAGMIVLVVATITTSCAGLVKIVAPGFARLEKSPALVTCGWLWLFTGLSALALLANPYGFELVRWLVGSVFWLRPQIGEWNPVPFDLSHLAFFLCVAIAAASFLLSRRPLASWELAVTGVLALMAFRSQRHTPLFCLVALAFVPPHLADALQRFQNFFDGLINLFRRAAVQKIATALLVVTSLGLLFAAGTWHKERPWTMEVPRREYPVAALDFIKQNGLHGNLLVFFDWGEECLWELPDSRVSIDGRLDTCYPRAVFDAQWNFYNADRFRPPVLDLEPADFALLPPKMAGAVMLWQQFGWQPVYSDPVAVVLVKNLKQFPKLAGLQATVQGAAKSVTGRAAFPDAPSARLLRP
jgi:hypothetical protein